MGMLVLSRQHGEQVVIGKDGEIVIQILELDNSKVRLGFTAPADVPIHRREVFDLLKQKKQEADVAEAKRVAQGLGPEHIPLKSPDGN